ncbi:MAG: bacteriophage holin [Gammaproteobacteria bacterium]|nr:bacteriophage holin [Gammaproteobacteria bacterium]
MTKHRLSPLAFGLSLGVIWGVSVLIMGLLAHYLSYGTEFVSAMGVVYIGYEPSIMGAVIGGIFGFIDALVGGALIAWLYNVFSGCCSKHCHKE